MAGASFYAGLNAPQTAHAYVYGDSIVDAQGISELDKEKLSAAALHADNIYGKTYTPYCLGKCSMVLEIQPGGSADFTKSAADMVSASFTGVKQESKSNCFSNVRKFVLANESYTIRVGTPNITCKSIGADCVDNGIYKDGTAYRMAWQPLTEKNKPSEKTPYFIAIEADRKLTDECKYVDAVPTILGVELKEFAWWNESWTKCRNVTIQNTYMSVENASVTFFAAFDSDMRNDMTDIRITDTYCNNEGAELGYGFESNVSGTGANITVKIPTLAASGNTTVAMYYGNPAAPSVHDLTDAYLYYDGMEATTSWEVTGTSAVTTDTGVNGNSIKCALGNEDACYKSWGVGLRLNTSLDAWIKKDATTDYWEVYFADTASSFSSPITDTNVNNADYWSLAASWGNWDNATAVTANGWSHFKIWWVPADNSIALDYNDEPKDTATSGTSSYLNTTKFRQANNAAGSLWIDELKVSAYFPRGVDPQTSVGAEESGGGGGGVPHSSPLWQNNASSYPAVYDGSNSTFVIQWTTQNTSMPIDTALIEGNWSGAAVNYSMGGDYTFQAAPNAVECGGNWSATQTCAMTYDNNYATFGATGFWDTATGNDTAWAYFNYTKPANAVSISWEIEPYTDAFIANITTADNYENIYGRINRTCLMQNPVQIKVEVYSDEPYNRYLCYNGTSWLNFVQWGNDYKFYEEAMWWDTQFNYVRNITPGHYYWKSYANDTNATWNASSKWEFTIKPPITISNAAVDGPNVYNSTNATNFSVRLYSPWAGLYKYYLESNISGALVNTSLTNATLFNFEYQDVLGFGNYTYRFLGYNGEVWNATAWAYKAVSAAPSGLSLASSGGWSILSGASNTITCSDTTSFTPALTLNGVVVANPYTGAFSTGTYAFICTLAAGNNYTPLSASNNLAVTSAATGCTNSSTFAYQTTITPNDTQTWLDFTNLYLNGTVRPDLNDIKAAGANITKFYNSTSAYILASNDSTAAFTISYGNYYANLLVPSGVAPNASVSGFSAIQLAPNVYVYTLADEMSDTQGRPPSTADIYFSTFCSAGSTIISLNDTNATVITLGVYSQLNRAELFVRYSATSFYYRDLLMTAPNEGATFYWADATTVGMVREVFTLYDNSGLFSSADLYVYKQINGALVPITEGALDITSTLPAYLIDGQEYQITITSGANSRVIGILYADSVNPDKSIIIGTTAGGTSANYTYTLTYNNVTGVIKLVWVDPLGNTINTSMAVYNYTDGALLFYGSSAAQNVEIVYTVGDVNGSYRVITKIRNSVLGLNCPGEDTVFAAILDAILGIRPVMFISEIPNIRTIMAVGCGIFLMALAMTFSGMYSKMGVIVVAIFAALLSYMGWWPVSLPLMAVITLFAIMNMISDKRGENK